MTWQQPDEYECWLLEDAATQQEDLLPLARVLAQASRIEPRLLRNARLHFCGDASPQLEARLWFSTLVAARNSREIVFHPGVARLLTEQLKQQEPQTHQAAWDFIRNHTRHWSPEDRLEQDLRHLAAEGGGLEYKAGLRDMLRRIHREQNPTRRTEYARWTRHTLPQITDPEHVENEARLLAHYAAQVLGATAPWSDFAGPPRLLPAWLAADLPRQPIQARLALDVAHDPARHTLVLQCREPEANEAAIELSTPLPAKLFIGSGSEGAWHVVNTGSRIEQPATGWPLRLVTLAGRQYDLAVTIPEVLSTPEQQVIKLYLSHPPEDADLAAQVSIWLQEHGLKVELLDEDRLANLESQASAASGVRLLRLWTPAAQERDAAVRRPMHPLPTLLLRMGDTTQPPAGPGQALTLDLPDLLADKPEALNRFLESLQSWLTKPDEAGESDGETSPDEIASLLAELDNPETIPPRRLEIGDRLAELGDLRPGVGVVEIEVALSDDDSDNKSPSVAGPNASAAMTGTDKERAVEIDSVPLLETDDQINKAIENAFFHAEIHGPSQLRAALARWRKSKPSDIDIYTGRGPAMLSVSDGGLGGFESDRALKSYGVSNHLFADVFGGAKLRWPILFFLSKSNPPGVNATTVRGVVSIIQLGPSYSLFDVTVAVSNALVAQEISLVRAWFLRHLRDAGMDRKRIAALHGFTALPKAVSDFIQSNSANLHGSHTVVVLWKELGRHNADLQAIAAELGFAEGVYGILLSDARSHFQLECDGLIDDAFAVPGEVANQLELAKLSAVLGFPSSEIGLWEQLPKGCFNAIRTVVMLVENSDSEAVLSLPAFSGFQLIKIDEATPVGQSRRIATNNGIIPSTSKHTEHPAPSSIPSNALKRVNEKKQKSPQQQTASEVNSMFEDEISHSDEHTFGGQWTLKKLQVLEKYLKAFNVALSRQNFMRVYIDAFAGTGRVTVKDGEGNRVIEGSARRALNVEPAFDHYCFIELQARKAAALNALTEKFPGKSIVVIQEDANVALKKICKRYDWHGTRAVLFLDPYGFHVDWSTLEAIAATKAIDVWYLFPYSGLYRQAARNADGMDKEKEEAITRLLGTDAWRSRFYTPPRQTDLFGHQAGDEREGNHQALLEFVSERLGGLFPAVTKPKVLYQGGDSRNPKGAPLFALYFAAANPDPKAFGLATKIAQDVLKAL